MSANLLANKGVKRLKHTLDTVTIDDARVVATVGDRYVCEVTLKKEGNLAKFRVTRPIRWGRHTPSREEALADLTYLALANPDGKFAYGAATSTFWSDFLGWPAYDLLWHKGARDKMNRKQFCDIMRLPAPAAE